MTAVAPLASAGAVHQNRRNATQPLVEQRQRGAVGEFAQLDVGGERRTDDDAVDLPGHGAHEVFLGCRVLFAVTEQDRVPGLPGPGLYTLQHAGVERVCEVRNDDADVPGAAGDQRLGGRVGLVTQLPDRGQHAFAGGAAHEVRGAQGSRHGGRGHLSPLGDVVNGYRHCVAPGAAWCKSCNRL